MEALGKAVSSSRSRYLDRVSTGTQKLEFGVEQTLARMRLPDVHVSLTYEE